ncbi:MAG TPA: sigma-54 dependent transcriptional regulator [Cyclobacteriaceae bacterium]|nr:sigma-54 dependent transcriptional regulator [Cyclobacteriaceae bacterium]
MPAVLIIDDELTLRGLLARIIQLEGYHVFEATTIKDGLKVLARENIQVVVSDVKLPDGNGVDLTARIHAEFPGVEIIVITAFGTIEDGVRAIKNGAFDYLTKGDHQEKIIPLLNKASDKALLQQKVMSLESRLQKKFGFENIIGTSASIRSCQDLAMKVAATDTNVLLLGETGTGKEVFAQAIHYESNRRSKPFVALNCSAFPKDLLESELFGHTEGAFTGAMKSKRGLIEEAQDGTLFLDEIGEMPADLQAKLLRVVETREYYKVGNPKVRHANVRFITATNRDLQTDNFRQDLYYRFSVFTIQLPALRERREDIQLLAEHFVREMSNKTITTPFLAALKTHPWKGNIRELKNIIERSIILSDGNELTADLLPADFNTDESDSLTLEAIERQHIRKILKATDGNKAQAAKVLGIGLTTLYQKIKDYGF